MHFLLLVILFAFWWCRSTVGSVEMRWYGLCHILYRNVWNFHQNTMVHCQTWSVLALQIDWLFLRWIMLQQQMSRVLVFHGSGGTLRSNQIGWHTVSLWPQICQDLVSSMGPDGISVCWSGSFFFAAWFSWNDWQCWIRWVMSSLIFGQYTQSLAHILFFFSILWWPTWSWFSISLLMLSGMITWRPLNRMPSSILSVSQKDQKDLMVLGSSWMVSGHPWYIISDRVLSIGHFLVLALSWACFSAVKLMRSSSILSTRISRLICSASSGFGRHDKESDMIICSPGRYLTVKSYPCILSNRRWRRGVAAISGFLHIISKGWWSVIIVNDHPYR